ncbi:MAG TPA: DUF58 domain-containing protein [Polyangiales bacterium]|nr:DUF58 domain-containing protein [Polyangiales bacterium]
MTNATQRDERAVPSQASLPARALASRPVRRVRGFVVRVIELFPWTPLGLALGAGAYLALRVFAYAQLDLVWLVTGCVVLGMCGLAPLFVVAGAIRLRFALRRAPALDALTLETDTPAQTGFALPALRLLPFTQVRWQWLAPAGASVETTLQDGVAFEHVTLHERGRHASIERRITVEDPFGLSRVSFRARELRASSVLPRIGGLRHLPALVSLSAGGELPHPMGLEDGDRLELQRYSPGDPARFIHWKVFARTRRLMVRKPERAVAVARRCAAFYVAGRDDDATAAVARLAIAHELLGREWVFGTDLSVAGTSQIDAALSALIASVNARELAGSGLAAFLAQVEKRGPASVIVFAPTEPGPWLDAVIAAARRRQLRVVIGVDGVAQHEARRWWLRWLTVAAPVLGVSAAALEAVLNPLARASVAVTLLDRETGRQLGEQERRALLRAASHLAAPSAGAVATRGAA